MGLIEPESRMHKLKYATLSRTGIFKSRKDGMRRFFSADTWMKIMCFFLAITVIAYLAAIVYDNYFRPAWHEQEQLIEIAFDNNHENDDIITLDDLSDEELDKVDFFEAGVQYNIEKPKSAKTVV
jgi:hypothetical protein